MAQITPSALSILTPAPTYTPLATYTPYPLPTQTVMPTQNIVQSSQTIAFSDTFDESVGSYDTNLWDCVNDCSIQHMFLRDGVLNLQRNGEGTTFIRSRSNWSYSELASLTGKFQISSNSNYGNNGFLVSQIMGKM